MSEGRYFLGQGGGLDHGSIYSFPVGLFPQRFLDHGLDVEVPHGLFEDREAVERYLALYPLTPQGEAVVRMVRLEVEAVKL